MSGVRLCITGTRDLSIDGDVYESAYTEGTDAWFIREVLSGDEPEEVITGAAVGVDVVAALIAMELFPNTKHRIIVPALAHDEQFVEVMERRRPELCGKYGPEYLTIERMPMGTNYMDRNQRMVDLATLCIGFVRQKDSAEQLRSGTWATIRRARKAGLPILISNLDNGSMWADQPPRDYEPTVPTS